MAVQYYTIAQTCSNPENEQDIYLCLGLIYRLYHVYDTAILNLEKALTI